MKRIAASFMVMGSFACSGCLPGDTRPEPAHIFVTAEASPATVNGFTTDDGWDVHFEKLLTALGNVQLEGDACNNYANAGYDRLFDFTVPGNRKLGEVYGLAECELRFRLRSPSDDSILENGTTPAERDFMREIDIKDPTQIPQDGPLPRTALYVRGWATRGAETKRFEWKFVGRYTLTDCANIDDGTKNTLFQLKGGDSHRSVISFHGEDLFRLVKAERALNFNLFAAADLDGNGDILMGEMLGYVLPAPFTSMSGLEIGLGSYLLENVLPRLPYFDGNPCAAFQEMRGPGGGGGPF